MSSKTETSGQISVLIADDHAIVREGIRSILAGEPDINVVGQAVNGLDAVELAISLLPDVILLDLRMPGLDGIEACCRIRRRAPTARILVVSQYGSMDYLTRALEAGARGFVLKQGAIDELALAIRVVMGNNIYLTPSLLTLLVSSLFEQKSERTDLSRRLSGREFEVLKMIGAGMTNSAVARELNLSIKTVQSHRNSIMTKLGLHDAIGLANFVNRIGLAVSNEEKPPNI